MNKKIIVFLLLINIFILRVNALNINDCDALAAIKLTSSLDEDIYICKNKNYGEKDADIYYSGEGITIELNNANIYYLSNFNNTLELNIKGNNIINLLSLDKNITISGTGSIKFKEDSYIKKTENGEKVYRFAYNNSIVVNNEKKAYEGTLTDFASNYSDLKKDNALPEEFKEEDYELILAPDYINMTPVSITPSWIATYITTDLEAMVEDGYASLKAKEEVVKPKEENNTKEDTSTTLETDNVTLISTKKLSKKYTLNVDDLSSQKEEYNEKLTEGEMLNLYDITIKKGKKKANIKDDNYTIKIKLDTIDLEEYDSYSIVYISDDGEIKEYIDGKIEGEYIVFKTPHLSQYGVIGKKKEVIEEPIIEEPKITITSNHKYATILKISLLSSIAIVSLIFIIIINNKSKKVGQRRKTIKNK